ncbi:metal ABC transporter solute-binding protein, Zn/Mn family [Corynebacterium uterequi]|uniref:Periplasmic solute binding protein family n=1 Tax=Corynebacterium uterequi TaxID=1072256 RepID=A0A0G3HIS1_9CORY|nr:zinc ABC transporter substrate-binding protein [Corynebacterium uterequi]AKK11838.1 Periplasmic solute binding protein family [Corynebacterium uterequi]
MNSSRFRRALAAGTGAALAAASLVSCTNDSASTSASSSTSDAPAAEALSVVTSTSVWSDVADAVLGDDASITAIIEDNGIDPHSFEPSAADLARGMDADLVVVGGGGYEAWLYEPIIDRQGDEKIVHALPLISHAEAHAGHDHDHAHAHEAEGHDEHDHAHEAEGHAAEGHDEHDHAHEAEAHDEHAHEHEGEAHEAEAHDEHAHAHEGHEHGDVHSVDGNEHIWYDVDAVTVVAEEIVEHAKEAGAEADATAVIDEMNELRERLGALGDAKVAQTETIADYIIDDSALTDITPESYRQAALNHSDPAAGDVAAFLDVINSGEVDVLLYNPQTATDLTKRIRSAAEAKGVAIVEIGEIPPADVDFLDYFHQVVDDLEAAVSAVK